MNKSQISKLKCQIQISNLKSFKFLVVALSFAFCLLSLARQPVGAQSRVESDNYKVVWPNLNMGAGLPTSDNYNLGVTTGQMAPGLYSSLGYKVRAGFQYIHSIIPFYFKLSDVSIDFGPLTPNDLDDNEEILTLTVNSGSAGGYQVTAQENDPLTSPTSSTIDDTTCDPTDPCDHDTYFGTWVETSTYGFGYTMTGDDVPLGFSSGTQFRNFADAPGEDPVKVMGKTPAEGHQAERGKEATMTMRINIGSTQAAGTYQNYITFIATPTF